MAMTDPLGDMLTRIRNGQQAKMDSVISPSSKLRQRVLDVLQREGYIRGYTAENIGRRSQHEGIRIELKYFEGQPAIQHVARVSKPGRRVYSGSQELPRVRNGLGITIVSTPKGVLSDAEAREQNVGGEVLAEVF
ncbi:30S ribosomal protein S8 [Novosphingopyxis sp.]|uniref:30S ribosomal protein S8 n=1 Tax=Novosphingopyxis sp. TaxID=2709690 RepID=UPI003B5A223F